MLKRITDQVQKTKRFSFYPDFLADSVAAIDFGYLQSIGVKACFIDLDGTVVARGQYDVDPAISKALRSTDLKVYIATNRPKGRDLKNLMEDLRADGTIHPHGLLGKPTKRYFVNALHDKDLLPHEAVMIGDRYLQDILGSNRAGMYALLVYKLDRATNWFDRLISAVERRRTLRLAKKYAE